MTGKIPTVVSETVYWISRRRQISCSAGHWTNQRFLSRHVSHKNMKDREARPHWKLCFFQKNTASSHTSAANLPSIPLTSCKPTVTSGYPLEEKTRDNYIVVPPESTIFYTVRCLLHKAKRFCNCDRQTNTPAVLAEWAASEAISEKWSLQGICPQIFECASQKRRRSSVGGRSPPLPPNGIGSPGTWAESHPGSIWVQVGLPLLKENPKIIQINWVDADSHSWQVVCWQRQLAEAASIDRLLSALLRSKWLCCRFCWRFWLLSA